MLFMLGADSPLEKIHLRPAFLHAYKNPHVFGFLFGHQGVYEAKVLASLRYCF